MQCITCSLRRLTIVLEQDYISCISSFVYLVLSLTLRCLYTTGSFGVWWHFRWPVPTHKLKHVTDKVGCSRIQPSLFGEERRPELRERQKSSLKFVLFDECLSKLETNFCSVFTILKMLFSYLSRGHYCQFEFTAMFFTAANIAPIGLLNQLFLSQTYQAQTQGIHCSSCKGVIFCFVELLLFVFTI